MVYRSVCPECNNVKYCNRQCVNGQKRSTVGCTCFTCVKQYISEYKMIPRFRLIIQPFSLKCPMLSELEREELVTYKVMFKLQVNK